LSKKNNKNRYSGRCVIKPTKILIFSRKTLWWLYLKINSTVCIIPSIWKLRQHITQELKNNYWKYEKILFIVVVLWFFEVRCFHRSAVLEVFYRLCSAAPTLTIFFIFLKQNADNVFAKYTKFKKKNISSKKRKCVETTVWISVRVRRCRVKLKKYTNKSLNVLTTIHVKIKAIHVFLARYERFRKKVESARHYVEVTLTVTNKYISAIVFLYFHRKSSFQFHRKCSNFVKANVFTFIY